MEFPDLGAHCSEPSCQRLGEGRSARGAGLCGEGCGTAGRARRVGSRAGNAREGRGSKLGAVGGGVAKEIGNYGKGAVCCK